MFFLYKIFINLYPFLIKIASPFNEKAKLWTIGRDNIFLRMQEVIDSSHPLIWMHCASLGEFEQGRPLIEKIRESYPAYKILLTFFSPSGFEIRKSYHGADYIFYLPIDSKANAIRFLNITKPSLVLFIKYEFWYYYLNEAKKRKIPLLLISAIFRKEQPFFSKFGSFYRSLLSCFSHLFVQNEESYSLLKTIEFNENVTVSGDTRFDRVIEIAEQFEPIAFIEGFCRGSDVIVAGSTWSSDDKMLSQYANIKNNIKCIVAPHQITDQRLAECLRLYTNSILFSELGKLTDLSNVSVIIIDNIGMLSKMYKYATVSYVGGGFGAEGVHNVLEAAVYGKPVVFGPVYSKFLEAVELIDKGGAFSITNEITLKNTLGELLAKTEKYYVVGKNASSYVYSRKGATDKIIEFIRQNVF